MFSDSFVPGIDLNPEVKPPAYPVETDHEFTPDEIELIELYKEDLRAKIEANKKFTKGVEIVSTNIICYCICKMLVYEIAGAAWPLVLLVNFTATGINNRDCFDFQIDRQGGEWQLTGIQKLIRAGLGLAIVAVNFAGTVGDVLWIEQQSRNAYNSLRIKDREYSLMVQEGDKTGASNLLLTMLGIGLVTGVVFSASANRN